MAAPISEKQLQYMAFLQRENHTRHHTEAEDQQQYELLRRGDPDCVECAVRLFSSDLPGHLSDDPVRNFRYLFVASVTLATRAAMTAGLDSERAYTISDLFIQKMDSLSTAEQVKALHTEMFVFFLKEIQALSQSVSRPVAACMDYIYNHLHEPIRLSQLAQAAHLNESYLSARFRRETGVTITRYILSRRMEAAENMLRFSSLSYAEISEILAFSSQSHFIKVFLQEHGCTPRQYREHSETIRTRQ